MAVSCIGTLLSSEPLSQKSRFAQAQQLSEKNPAQAHSFRRDAASMTRSQFVLYISQPSIVVTLKIVHEQQSKRERERKLDVYEREGWEKNFSYRKSPVGGPIHSPKRPHRSPNAKPSETGIAI